MHTHNHTLQTNIFTQEVLASWCLRAKSRSRTACDVETIKSLFKKMFCEANWGRCWDDSMAVTLIGSVTYNVPFHQLKWYYIILQCYFSTAVNPHTPTSILPSIARFLSLLSLHGVLVASATGVLRLHHIGEIWGAGEGLDVELFEHLIWGAEVKRKHELQSRQQS